VESRRNVQPPFRVQCLAAPGVLAGAFIRMRFFAILFLVFSAVPAFAQGGPPLLTTDPGTPGPENLEINIGIMPILRQDTKLVQLPQLDINYGVGQRIQLTVEVPFVWQSSASAPNFTNWGNTFVGVKYRFFDHGEDGLQISVFPQFEIRGSREAVSHGVADPGNRLLFPVEFTRKFGPVHLNLETGYYFQLNSPASHNERFFALAAGHDVTKKLEVIGEVFNDWVLGAMPKDTTFDAGFRYTLHRSFIVLFMAGRSFSPNSTGQPEFISYGGIQILLDKNGSAFHKPD